MRSYVYIVIVLMLCFGEMLGQVITLTPNPYTTPTMNFPTSTQIFRVRITGPREITVAPTGFGCAVSYTWTLVSMTPVFGGTPNPTFNTLPLPSNPSATPNGNFGINGPGTYVFRLCGTASGCGQSACTDFTLIAPPTINTNPVITMETITSLTLPISATEELTATIHDPTDQVNYYWQQTSGATTVTLPSPGNSIGNQASIARGSAVNFNSNLNLSGIQKPGNYCFDVLAQDERGGNGIGSRCFDVLPAASTLAISITPPGLAPDPNTLITPVNNVPLNAEITGINVYNDRIRYTWSQIAGATTITMPAPAYTANIASVPVGSTSFTVPPLNLNALAYGVYTLRLRAEDEYYPGTFVEQDITFTVKPPESNLDVTVTPSAVTTIDPYNDFPISGKVTGINVGSDVIRTYWRQDPTNPVQFTIAPFDLTSSSPKSIPLGTTEENSSGTLVKKIKEGKYIFWYVARDSFYNTADSAKIEIIVEPGKSNFVVSIEPNVETSITKTDAGWVLVTGEPARGTEFPVKGTVTGISDKTDNVITYWKMAFSPDLSNQPGENQNPTLPHTKDSPKPLPLGTTTDNSQVPFTTSPDNSAPGIYDLIFIAEDKFYNTIDSTAKVRIIVKKPVNIQPSVAFSPNGDGQNDIWKVKDIESFPDVGVRIVNERGELVFETTSVANLPDKGWDGRRKDGKFASEGAYYYEFFDTRDQTKVTVGSFIIVR